jgi:D-alanyl-lipoteichoic acid acyltransferase DltB (MBOAT superfamily)
MWLLLTIISINYLGAIIIARLKMNFHRGAALFFTILSSLGFLVYYKYSTYFTEMTNTFFTIFNISEVNTVSTVVLPLGISFFTFKAIGYTIDVYNGKTEPEYHLGRYSLFVTMFPQLLAGPIDRAGTLLPQIREHSDFNYERIASGLSRIFWGLFKKIVIADRLALFVNQVYENPGEHPPIALIIAIYFYSFQIYLDFSAYTDIAIGSARLFGFKIMENFTSPYFATSIPDFWRRWHISLSTWFRDYVYIPLGGNRVPKYRWFLNIFITFFLIGLWHGSNSTFIFWGILNCFYYYVSQLKKGVSAHIENHLRTDSLFLKTSRIFITFHLTSFAWIFFRSESIDTAFFYISLIFRDVFETCGIDAGLGAFNLLFSIALIIGYIVAEGLVCREEVKKRITRIPFILKVIVFVFLLSFMLFFGIFEETDFIYFRF